MTRRSSESEKFRQIYAITGNKGHGKDSFARMIQERSPGFKILHFADPLKNLARSIYGLTQEQTDDPATKEKLFGSPVYMDLSLNRLQDQTGLSLQPRGKIAQTSRELMQFLGTDYVRSIQDDYWIQALLKQLQGQRKVLVPDCRFLNEARAIRSVDGKVIRVVRIDFAPNADPHPSEVELGEILPDLELGVKTGDFSLPRRAAALIAMNKFDRTASLHYPNVVKAAKEYAVKPSLVSVAENVLGVSDYHCLKHSLEYYGLYRRTTLDRAKHLLVDGVVGKKCIYCRWQPLSSFNLASKAWDGVNQVCRSCASLKNKERYRKYDNSSIEGVWKKSKKQAGLRGIPFEISLEETETKWKTQNGRCQYSGRQMLLQTGSPFKVSMDRVDSGLGYTKGNVVLCCRVVNVMKGTLSYDEFFRLAKDIAQNYEVSHGK